MVEMLNFMVLSDNGKIGELGSNTQFKKSDYNVYNMLESRS
jgi:hypothetical protein